LPAGAGIMRRIEYALQWFISLVVIQIGGYPALSGLATSIILTLLFWQHRAIDCGSLGSLAIGVNASSQRSA
jgi:hypothetical protein